MTPDSTVECWGYNYGDGPAAPDAIFAEVSVGSTHPCGITADGRIECWDRRYRGPAPAVEGWRAPEPGELPEGQFARISVGGVRLDDAMACWGADDRWPTDPLIGTFTQVSVSPGRACAVRSDARLHCWGWRADSLAERGLRTPASPPEGTFAAVSVTGRYACGLRTDGSVECWGYGTIGRADPPDAHFAQISVGPHYACGITTGGAVRCWG